MSDFYLIKRPAIDASVAYQYKTDVLASYGNKEDRIAQRDIPRIAFSYSFLASDLKEALEINSSLMKTGNTGTIWVPDWTAGQELLNVISGENTYTAGLTNFVNDQYGVLYVNDRTWTIVTVNIINNSLIFDSTVEYDKALLMPLFACDVIGEPEISQANSLCYTFNVSLECKRPLFSSVYEWGTKFLGHDVWKDFHVDIDSSTLSRKSAQEVQENDYEIGVRDRFTFFERTYNSFGVKVLCKENELPSFRNFIKRRWGMTYSFFMPSGMADFQKAGDSEDTIGSYLRIRNNKHDFTARPYIVIQTDETANYAHVIALQDDNGDPVDSDYSGEFVTLVLEESFSFKYRDIDSVQILYFVRLNDDEISFGCIGNSGGEKPVYSIDLSMIETDFYDASLIDYNDTWGSVKDLNTIYLFKVSETGAVLENADEYGYSIIQNSSDYRNFIVPGKYEGTYAVKTVTSANCWILKPAWGPAMIKPHEDFVFQIEGKFDEYSGDAERSLITSSGIQSYCINLLRKNGYYWIYIGSERNISGYSYVHISMKMNRWLGDEFGWHEWAVQRHNDKLYFLCDGLLCGVSEDFYGEGYAGANADGAINYPQYQIARHGTVQQFRLAKGINVYSGETGIMNRVYRLNDYSLSKIREFDNATVCIYDFKNYNSAMGHSSLTVGITYYDNFNQTQFACGNTPRVRQALRICESQVSSGNNSPSYTKNATGLLINNSVAWCLHPNIRIEQRYYHDFWLEFTMVLSDDQSWEKQCLFPLRGIMINILISGGQYTVEACGLGSGIYVNIGEPLTFALGVNSQENRIVTYINGVRSGMIALDTYITASSVGYISVYPLAVRKGAAVESRSYYLHRLRLIEVCLTTAETYAVESEWTLGDLHTVPFTVEYGAYGIDNVRKLKLKDIESVHPLAPYFSNLRQSSMVGLCNKRWSDSSRKTELVSPNENAFYTVYLTNPITGDVGHGWYYTHKNYTGAMFESVIGSHEVFDLANQQMKTVPIVRGRRYDYENKNWKTYDATVLNFSSVKVVPPFNNTDYERVGNSLYFHGAGSEVNSAFMIDFLGEEGRLGYSSDGYISRDAARWGSEHFIRQVEFVINPPVNFAFEWYDYSSYGVNPTYYSRHMQMWTVFGSNFDSHDFYSDFLVPEGSRYNDYSAYSTLSVKTGCDNWEQWRQRINKNNYVLGGGEERYTPGKIDDGWVWITQPQLYTSNNVAPVHVVIQFVMTSPLNAGGYYNWSSIQQIEKVWINGKEFKTAELWWEQYKSKFSYNKNNVDIRSLTGAASGFMSVFIGFTEYYCHNFMEQAGTGHGGIWGCIYYGGNRAASGWSRYVSCIKAYETEHYNGDFDASAVMQKLQNERLPAVNITE